MITLIGIELYKIFKKWRTYIGFMAIGVMVPLIHTAMYFEGTHSIEHMTRNLQQSFVIVGNLLNGYFVSNLILNSLVIHIPFLIVLVAGDLLAGEATAGTYRLLITRPVSRFRIVFSKFSAAILYTGSLIFWLASMSLGLGILIFGVGELITFSGGTLIIFAKDDILWRFVFSYAFAILSMSVVASLAFLFSSLVENAIGPIITTMAVIIVFLIMSTIDIDFFRSLNPYLFTSYMNDWAIFFEDPVNWSEVMNSSLILLAHIVGFFSITAYIFKKKDILS